MLEDDVLVVCIGVTDEFGDLIAVDDEVVEEGEVGVEEGEDGQTVVVVGLEGGGVVEGEGDLIVGPSRTDIPHQVSHCVYPRDYVDAWPQEHQEPFIWGVV